MPCFSRCLSAAGVRFLGILSRQGIPPLLRSAYRAAATGGGRTLTRFTCSARVRHSWGRVPSLPRGRRCLHGQGFCLTAACRLATAGPCHPGTTTRPGESSSRGISEDSLAFALSSLPLACGPRTERGPLGFSLSFAPG